MAARSLTKLCLRALSVLWLSAVLLALVGCGRGSGTVPAPSAASASPALPEDVRALGLTIAPADAEGAISREQAIDVARSNLGSVPPEAMVDAYLLTVTDPSTIGSDRPLQERRVWLVRYSGLQREQPMPYTAEGMPTVSPVVARFAYVFVDAATGEYLYAVDAG